MNRELKSFSTEELKIIARFEGGESIRKLAEEYEGYGRTKIKNLLMAYIECFPEKSESIERLLVAGKTHKPVDKVDLDVQDLTEEEVRDIYDQIRNGETLTNIAVKYERTRDYIKNKILDLLDEEETKEFLEILRANQNKSRNKYMAFLEASEGEKITIIFNRLNVRKSKTNSSLYSFLFLTKKCARLKQYLLGERNELIEDEADRLKENDFWRMLYDSPTLLSCSLTDKIQPALENLDSHANVGRAMATRIIKDDASMLFSSVSRTNLQLRILKDHGLLRQFMKKPRNFRMSPELIYALIKFNGNRNGQIFYTKKQLYKKYGRKNSFNG